MGGSVGVRRGSQEGSRHDFKNMSLGQGTGVCQESKVKKASQEQQV